MNDEGGVHPHPAGSAENAIAPGDESLRLPDGRTLAYRQWGTPFGQPVIHLHGTPGSRMERYWDERLLRELGVRFITWDRPGYGFSDPPVGDFTLLDCASHIAALADHLGLARFRLNAMSGGAPFALATAHALKDRVTAVAILAGIGPVDRPGAFEGMDPRSISELRLARDDPAGLEEFLTREQLAPILPPSELEIVARDPGMLEMMFENHDEMSRYGHAGTISDYRALAAPWNFELEEIASPVCLWHGECDPIIPIHHAEHLASALPRARLRRCPGEGHLEMLYHPREILTDLLGLFR